MQKFIKKLFSLLLPALILLYPLDIALSSILKRSNEHPGEYEVWNDIYDGNINTEIAIYGSSRAWVHVNPIIMEEITGKTAYNFGLDGHNFWLQYLRHLEYLKHNEPPKHIILIVDVFSLQKRSELYQLRQFLPYMLWNREIKTFTSSFAGFNSADYIIPFVRYAGQFEIFKGIFTKILLGSNSKTYRIKGFKGMQKEWTSDFDEAKATMEFYTFTLNQESIDLFDQFIIECQKMNIDLTLVYTPEFIEGQSFIRNREYIISVFENFANQYGLRFLNYSDHELSHKKEFFYNVSHMNETGANEFTRVLTNDLFNHNL
jgi:hypothetical protein